MISILVHAALGRWHTRASVALIVVGCAVGHLASRKLAGQRAASRGAPGRVHGRGRACPWGRHWPRPSASCLRWSRRSSRSSRQIESLILTVGYDSANSTRSDEGEHTAAFKVILDEQQAWRRGRTGHDRPPARPFRPAFPTSTLASFDPCCSAPRRRSRSRSTAPTWTMLKRLRRSRSQGGDGPAARAGRRRNHASPGCPRGSDHLRPRQAVVVRPQHRRGGAARSRQGQGFRSDTLQPHRPPHPRSSCGWRWGIARRSRMSPN